MATPWNTSKQAYDWLVEWAREIFLLNSSSSLLYWDQRTFIPVKAHEHRSRQLALLAGLVHERAVDPRIGEALSQLEASPLESGEYPDAEANVREWRRDYDRVVKIPQDLAVELVRTSSLAETAWEQARPANDWAGFKPHLQRMLELKREEAEAVGYEKEPYDALLDSYEPGETAASLEPLFATLRPALSGLLERIVGSGRRPDMSVVRGEFDLKQQKIFSEQASKAIGFDYGAGRLDETAHPFTIELGPGDTRITTRYEKDGFLDAFFSTIHETGHALYEQGLPANAWGLPKGEAVSLGVHESQSRLWENMVARSRGFWTFFLPKLQNMFPVLKAADLDSYCFAVNQVVPGMIRTESDEVTYNLHILLRFELELALMRQELRVDDLPDAWNAKMKDLLGICPENHAQGVLQDVHWSAGLFGYFPTYTLGNLYAAQLYEAASTALGDLEASFAEGDFSLLLDWLRASIHSHGRSMHPRELIRAATGADPDPQPLIAYLESKYGAYYDC